MRAPRANGLLLVGHGSRDPRARAEHDALQARVAETFVGWTVESGFIELCDPPFATALTQLMARCDVVVIVPLLLFSGGHMQRDVPRVVAEAQRHAPTTQVFVCAPFGVLPEAIDVMGDQIQQAARDAIGDARGAPLDVTCLVVGRGASEPEAQAGFAHVVAALSARFPAYRFAVAYCGVQTPSVASALDTCAQARPRLVIVVPYLLFTGTLHRDLKGAIGIAQHDHPNVPIALAEHLGPEAIDAVVASVNAALDAAIVSKS